MKVDLASDAFLRHPGAGSRTLRDQAELVRMHLPILGPVWVTTTHAAAHQVLSDAVTYVRRPRQLPGASRPEKVYVVGCPRFVHPLFRNVTADDGADHQRLRSWSHDAFSAAGIDAMRPADRGDPRPTCWTACPGTAPPTWSRGSTAAADAGDLRTAGRARGGPRQGSRPGSNPVSPGPQVRSAFLRAAPALSHVALFPRRLSEEVPPQPPPGLIRELVEGARRPPTSCRYDELLAMVGVCGLHRRVRHHDAPDRQCSWGTLLQAPELAPSLQEDPRRITFFIEEVMRYHSPGHVPPTCPMSPPRPNWAGRRLDRGRPGRALADRRQPRPGAVRRSRRFRAPIASRTGTWVSASATHMCLGMQLARAEATVGDHPVLRPLLPRPRLARRWTRSRCSSRLGLRGVAELPVILQP